MINPSDYQSIADSVGTYLSGLGYSIEKMNSTLASINNLLGNVNNKTALTNAIKMNVFYLQVQQNTPKQLIIAISSLQNHTIKTYGDLNNFLNNHSIKVTQLFANLSNTAGYPINSENILG